MHSSRAEAQFARVLEVAGCRTQTELAVVLDIQQSSISDAKKRGSIPPDWLLRLLRLRGVNPDWIMLGSGPKFLAPVAGGSPSDPADGAEGGAPSGAYFAACVSDGATLRKILHCFTVRDLTNELLRRKKKPPEEALEDAAAYVPDDPA